MGRVARGGPCAADDRRICGDLRLGHHPRGRQGQAAGVRAQQEVDPVLHDQTPRQLPRWGSPTLVVVVDKGQREGGTKVANEDPTLSVDVLHPGRGSL